MELHDRSLLPTAWICRFFHKSSNQINIRFRSLDIRSGLIVCFTSIFFFPIQNYISVLQLHGDNSELIILNKHANIDPRSQTVRRINFVVAIPILIVFNILPVLVLILYSFKCSRAYLAKCRLNCLSLTVFTEKFYSHYKDGLDGGKT